MLPDSLSLFLFLTILDRKLLQAKKFLSKECNKTRSNIRVKETEKSFLDLLT